jgi:hypothetical protein
MERILRKRPEVTQHPSRNVAFSQVVRNSKPRNPFAQAGAALGANIILPLAMSDSDWKESEAN